MVNSIVQIIASVVGYFAARGIDSIIGKYLALIQIAFEKSASAKAREEYRASFNTAAQSLSQAYPDWMEWRKRNLGEPPR